MDEIHSIWWHCHSIDPHWIMPLRYAVMHARHVLATEARQLTEIHVSRSVTTSSELAEVCLENGECVDPGPLVERSIVFLD